MRFYLMNNDAYLSVSVIPRLREPVPDSETNHPTPYGIGVGTLPTQSRELLAQVIADRVTLLRRTIAEITSQLRDRQKLKESFDAEIEQKLCEVQTALYDLEYRRKVEKGMSRRRIALERQMADLQKEKREQSLLLWQDTVALQRELRVAEKELRTALLDLGMAQLALDGLPSLYSPHDFGYTLLTPKQ